VSRFNTFPFSTMLSFVDPDGVYWAIEYDGVRFWTYFQGKPSCDTDPFVLWPEELWPLLFNFCLELWGDE
jgi:hypothetical protein